MMTRTFTASGEALFSSLPTSRRPPAAASGAITEHGSIGNTMPRRRPRGALRSADDCAHRHLGLALRGLARQVLPERLTAATRARVRRGAVLDHRDQRQLLFAADAGTLRRVGGRRPRRL